MLRFLNFVHSCTGLIEMAMKKNSLISGDDFKSGKTKMKSVLVDFPIGAGIKVRELMDDGPSNPSIVKTRKFSTGRYLFVFFYRSPPQLPAITT